MLLNTVLDHKRPLLYVFNRFSNQYLCLRIEVHFYNTAIDKLSYIKVLKLRRVNNSD